MIPSPESLTIFFLKLVLVPILIGGVSLGQRRWGPTISGWLIGLPLTSAPVIFFLALEQGTSFASNAAQGTLLGMVSQAVFCLSYNRLSLRSNWPPSILLSSFMFLASTLLLANISLPLVYAFGAVAIVIVVVVHLMPKALVQVGRSGTAGWEILIRILAATGLVLTITATASWLGPRLSGLLTPYPIYVTVLAVSMHRFQGATSAGLLVRGVVVGSFTTAVFFLVVAGLIESYGIALAFSLAILASFLSHATSLIFVRH